MRTNPTVICDSKGYVGRFFDDEELKVVCCFIQTVDKLLADKVLLQRSVSCVANQCVSVAEQIDFRCILFPTPPTQNNDKRDQSIIYLLRAQRFKSMIPAHGRFFCSAGELSIMLHHCALLVNVRNVVFFPSIQNHRSLQWTIPCKQGQQRRIRPSLARS